MVSELRQEHVGSHVRVDGREGRLMYARVPAYTRIEVHCWYLITKSSHPRFDEDAVSLQWATSEPVTFLAEAAA